MKQYIFFALFFIGCNSAFAEKITFQMTAFGIDFGQMTVSKSTENDSTELYTLNAKGHLKLLWMERNDETQNTVRFRNGKLLYSSYRQIESGKLTKWITINYDGKKYVVNSNKGPSTFTEMPLFSVLKMYFSKPQGLTRVFSEAEAGFTALKRLDDNTYEIKNSEGDRSVYFYKNAAIDKLEFHTSIAKVSMKRI